MTHIKLADKIKETRIAIEKNKDVEELKKNLQGIEKILQEFTDDTIAKLYELGEKVTTLEKLKERTEQQEKVISNLEDRIAAQQSQIMTLANSLQKVVKQIDLIENNYSILQTIGGEIK